jgi:AAA ATPase domain
MSATYAGLPMLTAHTPRAVDAQLLREITVGRAHELGALRGAVQETSTSQARPHTLLVGARGSGESHLLALIANEIRARRLTGVRLAWFPEDVYSITSYADLLREVITQLGVPAVGIAAPAYVSVALLDELVPLFVRLLDDLTPYYKARMDEVAPAKAKVVSALCFARGVAR